MNPMLFTMIVTFFSALCAQGASPVAYTLVHGREPVLIDSVSEAIGQTWIRGVGVWEQHLIQKFYELLPQGEPFVVFDLGAQTGAFSLLATYFPLSTWYAFEPIAEAAEQLKQNCMLNGIENVIINQVAVADFNGTAPLSVPSQDHWGLATLGATPLRFNAASTRTVPVITLDDFVEAHTIKRVHFMKLDTEGSEYYILRGAQKLIMRDHPIMLMEYNRPLLKLKFEVRNCVCQQLN
jgi:FkbM family methyltransferase